MIARIPTPEASLIENYAILLKPLVASARDQKPKMIGIVGTTRNTPTAAEVGYGLHCDYWGKGYASEAVRLFIDVYWASGSMLTTVAFCSARKLFPHQLQSRVYSSKMANTVLQREWVQR